ncbi:hypothetical protein V496_02712 [Pseudogymnoascus sp. VKM F-4515 (FW-2607)]|nr:hypothetical protein V496_02712 [Pseudogymnoascus sp. VKM F-4515 (FW-2607)]KFY96276.1 hypothetical protein V498_02746 [Pseudogymnoascus sp. VKM F-4517 (FW-2822)]
MTADIQPTYPLSKAQADEIASLHEADTSELEGRLKELSESCQSNCASGFSKCTTHQNEMRKLYQNAYTAASPGRWTSYRPAEYTNDLKRMFDAQASIEKINGRVRREKIQHIKDSQCTFGPSDHPTVKKTKIRAAELRGSGTSTPDIDSYIIEEGEKLLSTLTPEQQELQAEYDKSKSDTDKYSYLRTCACAAKATDTPRDVELRLKWMKLFDNKLPYNEILPVMEKDVADANSNVQLLENRLADLRNAQAANNKAKAAKEESKRKQARDAIRRCCSEGCGSVCELSGPNADLGCERCFVMKEEGALQNYSWFCSPECAKTNAASHNTRFHST